MRRKLSMLLLLTLTLGGCASARASEPMTLFAVNVGKADALLLHSGKDVYLIDTGTEESWGALSRALKMLNVTHLTGVIATHADKDHIGGLPMLAASSVEVDAWYASAYSAKYDRDEHPAALAAASRAESVRWLSMGETLALDGGSITVLGPVSASDEENDNSLVLLCETEAGRMLLMGDAELAEERELLAAWPDLPRCQVLKVGHHGGDDATSSALLKVIQPDAAIISTSTAERAETPSAAVLSRLAAIGAQTAVTQDGGAGVLVTLENGQAAVSVSDWTELPEPVGGIKLTDKDAQEDTVCLVNTGGARVDLTDWFLRSERGGEVFVFPKGTELPADGTLTLGTFSTDETTDLVWQDKNVWHNKKDDAARLYDPYGREIDALE